MLKVYYNDQFNFEQRSLYFFKVIAKKGARAPLRPPPWIRLCHRNTLQKIINNFEKKTRSTNNNNNNNTDKRQTIVFPWIPKIGLKIKKEIQKFRFGLAFQTGPDLKNILCKNKDKLIPNSYPGVCDLKYSCGSVFNGETKKENH